MKIRTRLHKLFLFFAIIFIGLILVIFSRDKTSSEPKNTIQTFESHENHFYEPSLFLPAVKDAEKGEQPNHQIKGGVVPHHLLPSAMIARLFKRISWQNPTTILLIGPNHPEKGERVLTTDWGWETPFGAVAPDTELTQSLKESGASIDHGILENEHSVAGMMAFIKYFMPNTKVATLILSNTLTLKDLNKLAEDIVGGLPNGALVVAPIDFSHYLTSSEADRNDSDTWNAILKYDYSGLLSMNNDYLDGRTSLVLELLIMEKLGYKKIEQYEHTNSGVLMNDPYSQTTSYFSFGFIK